MKTVLERIFEYDNYRHFLRDYFEDMKRQRSMFSHRYFARRAGFASSSFCAHVMEGKKNLSRDSIAKMVQGLGLKGKPARYFEILVSFNQSKNISDKELNFNQLNNLRKSMKFYRVRQEQYALYDEWYYAVVRELLVYARWDGDYRVLGALVQPPIGPEKARKAVETLEATGLVTRLSDGRYVQNAAVLSAQEAPAVLINKLKKEYLFKAFEAQDRPSGDGGYSSSVTLAMSARSFDRAREMVDEVRKKILVMAMDDERVDRIYQASFHIFALSQPIEQPAPGEAV